MKKITLFAAMAAVAMSANAQFTVADGSIEAALKDIPKATIDYIILDEAKAEVLNKDANYKMNYLGPDEVTRFLYVWEGTMVAGDSNEPGVDGGNGYVSFNIANGDWCGSGYNINKGAGVDLSHLNDNTIFHMSYRSNAGKITSMYVTTFNDGNNNNVAIGDVYEGNPSVGPTFTEEWQTVQMTIGDLKKLKGSYNMLGGEATSMNAWTGNIFAFGGSAANGLPMGANICFDGVYFITPGEGQNAIENITVDGNEAAVYFNLQGQRVANPTAGQVYIVKAGKDVKKVIL